MERGEAGGVCVGGGTGFPVGRLRRASLSPARLRLTTRPPRARELDTPPLAPASDAPSL